MQYNPALNTSPEATVIKFLGKLFARDPKATEPVAEPAGEPVDYNGYSISAAPIREGSQYRTAGSISKEIDGELRSSAFIRADNHTDRQQAIDHSIGKGKQVVDERGDKLFNSERC